MAGVRQGHLIDIDDIDRDMLRAQKFASSQHEIAFASGVAPQQKLSLAQSRPIFRWQSSTINMVAITAAFFWEKSCGTFFRKKSHGSVQCKLVIRQNKNSFDCKVP